MVDFDYRVAGTPKQKATGTSIDGVEDENAEEEEEGEGGSGTGSGGGGKKSRGGKTAPPVEVKKSPAQQQRQWAGVIGAPSPFKY